VHRRFQSSNDDVDALKSIIIALGAVQCAENTANFPPKLMGIPSLRYIYIMLSIYKCIFNIKYALSDLAEDKYGKSYETNNEKSRNESDEKYSYKSDSSHIPNSNGENEMHINFTVKTRYICICVYVYMCT
jgi:hypothetical protein